tara:strand:- start:152 stop:973 length:822 start_codon:yes stop_codon:yes gene_type:complete
MNIRPFDIGMDEMYQALLLFWIPVAVVPLGIWVFLSFANPREKNLGKFLAFVGFAMVCLSPWTVPSSPSSAAGHLLGAIVGPIVLILIGLYLISFSGNVPVGRLPKSDRKLGVFMNLAGFIWLVGMHWWILTPQLSKGDVNSYWYVFWPTFLLFTASLSSFSAIAMLTIGVDRKKEANSIFMLSGLSFLLLFLGLNVDGPLITAELFREHLWLAVADLAGLLVGSSLSILVFAIVIFVYERNLPPPQTISPPTKDELEQVADIVSNHLGGEQE